VIAEEYVDNDVSAFGRTSRPAYERMLADLAAGERDAIIVYNLDRLTRNPKQLESLIDLCDQLGVSQLATATGDFNLGNDQGLFVARIMSAVAAQESGRKSARLRRKMEERAEQGLPGSSGGRRAYGWEQDKTTLIPSEAEIIQRLASRYLAGESITSLANWLNAAELPSATGGRWTMATVRTMLSNPRLAGHRVHRGKVVSRGIWEPILTDETHEKIIAIMERRKVAQVRSPRRALLSRLLRCGRCGSTLNSGGSNNGQRRYVCQADPGRPGCGRLAMRAEPLEAIITEAILIRLDSPEFAKALSGREESSSDTLGIRESLASDQAQMDELAGLWADRAISSAEWKAAREPIEARIRTTERRLASLADTTPITGLAGHGAQLREQWEGLNLTRQHAIITAIIDTVTILPAVTQGSRDYLARIQPNWRL
jgi:DNA invertase Pin-like site-specific DNA recombinase